MIKGHCKTNVDKFKTETWPTQFVGIPRKGDWVESENGRLAKVVGITHKMAKMTHATTPIQTITKLMPQIVVELHSI